MTEVDVATDLQTTALDPPARRALRTWRIHGAVLIVVAFGVLWLAAVQAENRHPTHDDSEATVSLVLLAPIAFAYGVARLVDAERVRQTLRRGRWTLRRVRAFDVPQQNATTGRLELATADGEWTRIKFRRWVHRVGAEVRAAERVEVVMGRHEASLIVRAPGSTRLSIARLDHTGHQHSGVSNARTPRASTLRSIQVVLTGALVGAAVCIGAAWVETDTYLRRWHRVEPLIMRGPDAAFERALRAKNASRDTMRGLAGGGAFLMLGAVALVVALVVIARLRRRPARPSTWTRVWTVGIIGAAVVGLICAAGLASWSEPSPRSEATTAAVLGILTALLATALVWCAPSCPSGSEVPADVVSDG